MKEEEKEWRRKREGRESAQQEVREWTEELRSEVAVMRME